MGTDIGMDNYGHWTTRATQTRHPVAPCRCHGNTDEHMTWLRLVSVRNKSIRHNAGGELEQGSMDDKGDGYLGMDDLRSIFFGRGLGQQT